jgi:hypothetical protein
MQKKTRLKFVQLVFFTTKNYFDFKQNEENENGFPCFNHKVC